MEQTFLKKTALITGAGSGIGRAIALRFADFGIRPLLVGRKKERLLETSDMIRKQGGEAFVLAGDITDTEFLRACVEEAIRRTGQLDVLVNNAGMALNCPFEKVTEAEYDAIFALNVRAPFFLCQEALPWLRRSDCATILNIASVTGHKGYVQQSAYTASKHALIGFSKTLAAEVYKENIRVHVISPGGVYTDMVAVARPDLSPEDMILAEDIADIAAFYLEHRFTNAVVDEICVHRVGKTPFL